MTISQTLLPEFDQEMANTRKILAVVPDDKLDFKPHEKSMGLGRLAGHVAELPNWAKTTVETEKLEMKDGDMKPYIPASRDEILARFDQQVKEARAAIERTPDSEWSKTWSFIFNGQSIFSMPRIACYRNMCMNHLIHHRGQLGVYLRLNNVEFPGMYGPSADEMKFWQKSA